MIFYWFFATSVSHASCPLFYASFAFRPLVSISQLVALNDLVSPENIAYLLKYDTVYGKYSQPIENNSNSLSIAGREYKYFQEKDPEALPWKDLKIDIVFECTGVFRTSEGLNKHI